MNETSVFDPQMADDTDGEAFVASGWFHPLQSLSVPVPIRLIRDETRPPHEPFPKTPRLAAVGVDVRLPGISA